MEVLCPGKVWGQLKHEEPVLQKDEMTRLIVHSLPDVTNYRISLREVSTQESQLVESSNQNNVL